MQSPLGTDSPIGVVYNTSMNRPDAALALCALYGFDGKREARVGSICVTGAGLTAAVFCDIVGRLYMIGPARSSNTVLPVGLAAVEPLPPDAGMLQHAVERRNEQKELQYARSVRRIADTADAEAVLRNGVAQHPQGVVVLSAPATYLAKSLDLYAVKELYIERVKRLVIVDCGEPQRDVPALRRILAEWPTPIVYCGKEVGESLPFPGAPMESGFAWAPAHPVVDAYRAFKPMPYDAPSYDLAAACYAVHPDSAFFRLSEPGVISVSDRGRMQFQASAGGKSHSVIVVPEQKENTIQAFVELVSAKPVPPPVRPRRQPDSVAAPKPVSPPAGLSEKQRD
jgi:hypothetical protein